MIQRRFAFFVASCATLVGAAAGCDVDVSGGGSSGALDASADAVADAVGNVDAGSGFSDAGSSTPSETQVARPTFSPPAGTYAAPQNVTLSSATPGATIRFTTDGSTPTAASVVYTAPLRVAADMTIKAIAFANGLVDSLAASATYDVNGSGGGGTNPISFTPSAGEYTNNVELALASVSTQAVICYTDDGSRPGCETPAGTCAAGATPYPGTPIVVSPRAGGGPTVVKAIGCIPQSSSTDMTTSTCTFRVSDVAVSGAGNLVGAYEPTSNALGMSFWNGGGATALTLATVTTGGTVRYSYATGATLPAPPDVNCTQTCTGADATCTECTPGAAGCTTASLPPLTTVKAVGCKADFAAGPVRQVVFADPSQYVVLAPPTVLAAATRPITLTASDGATICYTLGPSNSVDPTCNPTTGACTTTGSLPAGISAGTYASASKPQATEGATIRAIACKAGVANPSNRVSATFP